MRKKNSKTQSLREMLKRYKIVSKIFMTRETYVSILEDNKGIKKIGDSYQWDKQTPVKYENGYLMWGDIPVVIDDYGPDFAVVEG